MAWRTENSGAHLQLQLIRWFSERVIYPANGKQFERDTLSDALNIGTSLTKTFELGVC